MAQKKMIFTHIHDIKCSLISILNTVASLGIYKEKMQKKSYFTDYSYTPYTTFHQQPMGRPWCTTINWSDKLYFTMLELYLTPSSYCLYTNDAMQVPNWLAVYAVSGYWLYTLYTGYRDNSQAWPELGVM